MFVVVVWTFVYVSESPQEEILLRSVECEVFILFIYVAPPRSWRAVYSMTCYYKLYDLKCNIDTDARESFIMLEI